MLKISCRPIRYMVPLFAAVVGVSFAGPIQGQDALDYPSQQMTIVVPFPPAGPPDLLGRAIAEHLTRAWGQTVIVENRPGANGVVAMQYMSGMEADGHTVMIGSVATHAMNPALQPTFMFDTIEDFVPVTQLGYTPMLITAHPSLGISSIEELVALAQERPGAITYASVGQGSAAHLAAELLQSAADIEMSHIPFNGIAQASLSLLAGEVQIGFSNVINLLPYVNDGSMVALGVTSSERDPSVPDIATVAEDYPGVDVELWWGVFAPAGTPEDVIEKLNAEINVMLEDENLIAEWRQSATTLVGSDPANFAEMVREDFDRWSALVDEVGITAE